MTSELLNNGKFTVCKNDKYNDKKGVTNQSSDVRENNNNKKRKIIPYNTDGDNLDMQRNKWLTDIPLSNAFSVLTRLQLGGERPPPPLTGTDEATEPMDTTVPKAATPRPPPIHIEAQIIELLRELLKKTADTNYTLKQLKDNHVKVQANTTEIYRRIVLALKEKSANFNTYQLKKHRSYKAVLRGIHPKTNTNDIISELKDLGYQVRQINNIVKHDTKQSLPLFFIEFEPKKNNKDIYKINKLLNSIITFEPPKTKRDIPQCIRCQAYGHTKNYCFRNPACVKCAGMHLISNCPTPGKIDEVKCHNCKGNHPASYRGCIIRKQLQHKLYPTLRANKIIDTASSPAQTNIRNSITNNTHRHPTPRPTSYADITQNRTQSLAIHDESITETSEIKKLLIQTAKNTESISTMILEQSHLLKEQSKQINLLLELLTNVLTNKPK
ncbi:Nucleic-acid-binding protein from transposon X-element [Anthophora plagiata]